MLHHSPRTDGLARGQKQENFRACRAEIMLVRKKLKQIIIRKLSHAVFSYYFLIILGLLRDFSCFFRLFVDTCSVACKLRMHRNVSLRLKYPGIYFILLISQRSEKMFYNQTLMRDYKT